VVDHIKRMDEASMDYPIIMTPDGQILDGYHRILKALYTGNVELEAYKLDEFPAKGEVVSIPHVKHEAGLTVLKKFFQILYKNFEISTKASVAKINHPSNK
jgi:hypothetical protein